MTTIDLDDMDFQRLASKYRKLKPFVSHSNSLNFKDPLAVKYLTLAILKVYFGLEVQVVSNKLMPTIPNRWAYLDWVKNIWLSQCSHRCLEPFRLVDIGTGYLPIYPLLASRLFDNCLIYATDIDESSLQLAAENVDRNNLTDKIKLIHVNGKNEALIPADVLDVQDQLHFVVMNPPFYDMKQSSTVTKSKVASGLNLGSTNELYTQGGELSFISRLIKQSMHLRHRITWYSTLIGIKSNVFLLVEQLKSSGISNYALSVISKGKTIRWLLAWSFLPYRVDDTLSRCKNKALSRVNPPSALYVQAFDQLPSFEALLTAIHQLANICISQRDDNTITVIILCKRLCSRSATRPAANGVPTTREASKVLVTMRSDTSSIHFQWLEGFEHQQFISFAKRVSNTISMPTHTSLNKYLNIPEPKESK